LHHFRDKSNPDIGRKSQFFHTPPEFNAPIGGELVGILQRCLVLTKLDGGLKKLHAAVDVCVEWLSSYGI